MKKLISAFLILGVVSCIFAKDNDKLNIERIKELDAYWTEVARCVNEGDFEAFKKTVHEDAILALGTRDRTVALSTAMLKWKVEFDDTKDGKIKARVVFRFSQRIGDKNTAHETGMFMYYQLNKEGKASTEYIHFEGLLIKKKDGWQIMMEYQKESGTKEEWDKLK
jgi:hypothetical protein